MDTRSYDDIVVQNELLGRQLHEAMQKNKKLLLCVETLSQELEERDGLMVSLQNEYDNMKLALEKATQEVT